MRSTLGVTHWQTLEVKNAIRLKAFRGEITPAEMNQSIAAFEQDIATDRWERPTYKVAAVEQKAEELSTGHSVTLGCRSLDIIHVAAALVIGTVSMRSDYTLKAYRIKLGSIRN